VKYGNLVSPLIEAVKELDNKISEKNIRIKELEERLNRLEEMIGSGDVSDFNEGVLR